MTIKDLKRVMRQNVREYGMYIALFVIMTIFTITTKGAFISSKNISDLLNQTGYIAVLAVGMTLVIVIRHIDLSVGFLAGFLGAVAAVMLVFWKLPVYIVIPAVFALGIFAGLLTAFPVAQLGVPSFVASLAGWLIYRGAILLVLMKTGTIVIPDPVIEAIGEGFVPDIFPGMKFLPGNHKLTLIIGILIIIFYIVTQVRGRINKEKYDFEVLPLDMFVLKLIFISVLISAITWILSGYEGNGISWLEVIVVIVVAVYHFIASKTVLGRHIYAAGGNPEAAELSGISVKKITYITFGSMGLLCALSGILYAARLKSATPQAGTLFELDAIAAAYIGGVSAAGGVGKIPGSLIGALVYISLTNGMNLMSIDMAWQYIVRGVVLLAAVIFDVTTRRTGKKEPVK